MVQPGGMPSSHSSLCAVRRLLPWLLQQLWRCSTQHRQRLDLPHACPPCARGAQGVTTALALQEGLSSPLFAVSLAFSVIVMYDAMGVRQHAGKQAVVLNQVRPGAARRRAWANSHDELRACRCSARARARASLCAVQMMTELWQNSPSAIGDNINLIKLKEVLGHTPRQVLCGAVLGFLVAILGWR